MFDKNEYESEKIWEENNKRQESFIKAGVKYTYFWEDTIKMDLKKFIIF